MVCRSPARRELRRWVQGERAAQTAESIAGGIDCTTGGTRGHERRGALPKNFMRGYPARGEDISRSRSGTLQGIQELSCDLEICGVEALSEPAVDVAQNPPCLLAVPVLHEQAAEARCGSKLQRAMTATTGQLDGGPEAGLRLGPVGVSLAQEQLPPGSDGPRARTRFRGPAPESPSTRRGP
jgi:hypothetical protein